MSEKATLLRQDDELFTELRKATEGLSDDAARIVWLGTWSVREILIHVSGWHREMVPAFERIARGEAPFEPGTYDDYDGWNAKFVAGQAGATVADVRAELVAAHAAFARAAGQMPEEAFAAGAESRGLFEGTGPAHYPDHAAQISAWRATLG